MMNSQVSSLLKSFKTIDTVVLYGVETHICVYQTAIDLLKANYKVFVVVDAASSMQWHDRNIGLAALRDAGVKVVSFQQLCFDLMKTFENPKFKDVLKIVRGDPPVQQLDIASGLVMEHHAKL